MNTSPIIIKKQRELGEVLGDTFKILRRNFKVIFSILIKTCSIPFLLFMAASFFNGLQTAGENLLNFADPFAVFDNEWILISSLIVYLFIFIYLSFLYATVNYIIKSYIDNNGNINQEEVVENVTTNISKILLTGGAKYGILFLSVMLCVFPVLILMTPMWLVFSIVIFEEKSPSDAISEAFTILKKHWFMMFLTQLVLLIIWYAIVMGLSMPSAIYIFAKTLTAVQEQNLEDPTSLIDNTFLIMSTVVSGISYIIYIILPIGGTLVYFNLREQHYQSGSLEQIDRIGES